MAITSNKFFFPFLLVLVFIGTYSYTFDPKIAQLGDNASYYMLGKSISQGEGYVNISKITKTPNNHYPPGYPAILGAAMVVGSDIVFLKLLNGLFLIGSALLFYLLIKTLTGNRMLSFVIATAMLVNFHLLQYGSMLMSEVPYLFFSLLALLLVMRTDVSALPWKDPMFWGSLLAAVMAYYIRSLGIALFAGILLYFILSKAWKHAMVFGGLFVLAVLPWFIRSQNLGGGSYMKQLKMVNPYRPELGAADFSDYSDRFISNIGRYLSMEIPSAIFPAIQPEYGNSASGNYVIGILLCSLIIFAFFRYPKYVFLILGYLLATFAILMIWPDVWVGVRFIVPLIPLLIAGPILAIYLLIRKITGKDFNPAFLFVIVLIMSVPLSDLHEQAKQPLHAAWKNYYEVAEWLKKNETPDVVVSCGKPSLFYLYSGTHTMRYAFETNPEKLLQDLEKNQVDYVVLDQVYGNTIRYLLPAIQAHPERFEQVYHVRNPDTFLLKFNP